jgi:hypothetical protein
MTRQQTRTLKTIAVILTVILATAALVVVVTDFRANSEADAETLRTDIATRRIHNSLTVYCEIALGLPEDVCADWATAHQSNPDVAQCVTRFHLDDYNPDAFDRCIVDAVGAP